MISGKLFALISHQASLSLLRNIRDRQEDSLVEVHEQYAMLVYSLVYSIFGSVTTAEEMTQNVFMALWDEAPMLDEAQFTLLDYLLGKTQALIESDLQSRYGRDAKAFLRRERKISPEKLMILDLLELPENLRNVLYLAHCLDLSLEAIALCLEEPLGLVKSNLKQAMDCLQLQYSFSRR